MRPKILIYYDSKHTILDPYNNGVVFTIYYLATGVTSKTLQQRYVIDVSPKYLSVINITKISYFQRLMLEWVFIRALFIRAPSYREYISQLIRFARVCSHVDDFNTRNKCLTAKLLKQGYRYHKLRKAFSKFYRRHYELISKFNVGLKLLLHQGLSEPEFYGDLVYKFK